MNNTATSNAQLTQTAAMNALNDLLDDLSGFQLRHLLAWHWCNNWPITRASITRWRGLNNLKVD